MTSSTLFQQQATGSTLAADPTAYTLGVQVAVDENCTLDAIWFYSAAGASVLPGTISLFAVAGPALVHSETATWSGAAGSGWVRAAFSSPPALAPSTAYKACVTEPSDVNWYSATSGFWDTGAGGSGITSGPLSAPNNASSADGQDTFFASGIVTYPSNTFGSANYWIDPEVSPVTTPAADSDTASGTDTGTVTATLTSPDTAAGADTAAVGVAGAEAASGTETASLSLAGPDSGSGSDTGTISITGADTGTGADAATVSVPVSGADTGSAADSATAEAIRDVPSAGHLGGTAVLVNAFGGTAAITNDYGGSAE